MGFGAAAAATQLDERVAQTKKSLDSGAAGMRALNERNKSFNVHTDTHIGRKKRLEEAKRRYGRLCACVRSCGRGVGGVGRGGGWVWQKVRQAFLGKTTSPFLGTNHSNAKHLVPKTGPQA